MIKNLHQIKLYAKVKAAGNEKGEILVGGKKKDAKKSDFTLQKEFSDYQLVLISICHESLTVIADHFWRRKQISAPDQFLLDRI